MKILFVCLGNICRSPLADGILKSMVNNHNLNWHIDSAGTGDWHVGEAPDKRAQAVSKKYGVEISNLVARQFNVEDFDNFDVIYAMDHSNYNDLHKKSRNEVDKSKIKLFLNELNPGKNEGVVDPWFDDKLFEPVFSQIQATCEQILKRYSNK